jgi:hypothetical protein
MKWSVRFSLEVKARATVVVLMKQVSRIVVSIESTEVVVSAAMIRGWPARILMMAKDSVDRFGG